MLNYVLITPAHNEEAFIERTIQSVVNQTVRPLKWVVVSDGSTDGTREIVERHARQEDFIGLVHVERPEGRHFANKVRAFNHGLAELTGLDFDCIGNLDSDIALESNYFETILGELEKDSDLGIAGGMVSSKIGGIYVSQDVALDSVAGAVQLFRRRCFEEIGGYLALPHGGIDAAAEITARMMGWKVRTFPEVRVLEHRRTGTATARPLASRVKEGRRLYSLGYGFLFYCFRCLRRSMDRPRFIGSAAAMFGYLASLSKRDPIVLPTNVVKYLQAEQRRKLWQALRGSLKGE